MATTKTRKPATKPARTAANTPAIGAKQAATQAKATPTTNGTGPAPTGTGRGGARAFGTGVQQRRTPYLPGTTGHAIFAHYSAVAQHLGVQVPPMALVVAVCTAQGIKAASARAGYTHAKQFHGHNTKAGRATPAQVQAMASYNAPVEATQLAAQAG